MNKKLLAEDLIKQVMELIKSNHDVKDEQLLFKYGRYIAMHIADVIHGDCEQPSKEKEHWDTIKWQLINYFALYGKDSNESTD